MEPITADDDRLRAVLGDAHIPSLLPALAVLTGDRTLLAERFRPDPTALFDPNAGLSETDLDDAGEQAFEALRQFRDGSCVPAPPPSEEHLAEIMGFVVGDPELVARHRLFFREELGLGGDDPRAPQWTKEELAPDRPFRVAVIGAGMSGLAAAHRLDQAGIDHVVLEKGNDVGGTWLDNSYPGCRVDVPSHMYSYSFAQRADWPQLFSRQPDLLAYFRSVADKLGLRERIRFGTEVRSATFDESLCRWQVDTTGPDGDEVLEVDAVVSAVGQLNTPSIPNIPGADTFTGASFHSARWDHDVELAGKRVAVIGTGASALQLVPEVAGTASELLVFQRTPNWLAPTENYRSATPPGLLWLMQHVPTYAQWYRLWLFWQNAEGLLPAAKVDPDWHGDPRSVSELNDMVRQVLTADLEAQVANDPELAAKVVPQYPPSGKRIIRDDGLWLSTLQRDDVRLVDGAVEAITATGVVVDGEEFPVEVIVYATGFQASNFLTPMRVVGRAGVELHDAWDGDARAHLGMTVPGFPNLFLLYGPNTNIVVNGSIIFFSECEVDHVLGCLRMELEKGIGALDTRVEAHEQYNQRIDVGNQQMAWGVATVNSWYRNSKDRISQNWPFSLLEFWQQTREPNPEDYEALPLP